MPEELTLVGVILWILYSGGAGTLAWWLIDNVKFLKALEPDVKRYVGLGLPGVIALGTWGLGIVFTVVPLPVDARDWVSSAFGAVLPAVILAQTLHGATTLRSRRSDRR